ncbi:MAG: hypothetical protein O6831_09985 [Alphaproteobacteria bacterium]|nr:hypothetical protein [Alphaproteobacteria bacterium]MCZ6609426.1 hypothetical protein [Alphaproteobacteria bacterium]
MGPKPLNHEATRRRKGHEIFPYLKPGDGRLEGSRAAGPPQGGEAQGMGALFALIEKEIWALLRRALNKRGAG